ncbi:MAG: hypothetical protein Q8934_11740 [Bacillota bacterium]|nr:hypothetical protein [Bacillota bacterium]
MPRLIHLLNLHVFAQKNTIKSETRGKERVIEEMSVIDDFEDVEKD